MKHENWAVQCPTDYSTNEKWKEIVSYINDKYKGSYDGNLAGQYYGVVGEYGINYSERVTTSRYAKILTLEFAHEMLFSEPVKYTIYQELLLLKFKKVKSKGKIVLDENGSYQMKKQATDHSFFLWNHSNPNLDLIEYWVDGIKVSTMNVEQLKEFLTKIETK